MAAASLPSQSVITASFKPSITATLHKAANTGILFNTYQLGCRTFNKIGLACADCSAAVMKQVFASCFLHAGVLHAGVLHVHRLRISHVLTAGH